MAKAQATLIKAGPTKAFFVKMLTRDIELADAILDLLDNCVDGVVRELKKRGDHTSNGKPYKGFKAELTITPQQFEISDNCGGIPQDVAEKSAFMLGRPDSSKDSDIETVGIYGIGMKRAMFKMGKHSIVTSQPDTGTYKVEILPEWLEDEPVDDLTDEDAEDEDSEDEDNDDDEETHTNPWRLTLVPTRSKLPENGTKIVISQLYDEVARQFDSEKSSFLVDLEKEISRHYALIIGKGFEVKINGTKISPVNLTILSPSTVGGGDEPQIEPFVFTGTMNGVQIEFAVGFYRPLSTESELEDEDYVASSRDNAGWTVVCNDRVVIYNDKTFKTGWGTKGITPGYHNQFISIRGIVSFRSKDSLALPLNTTKRGLATDSLLYQAVLDHMRTGLKHFTSFTNRWKKHEEEVAKMFRELSAFSLKQIVSKVERQKLAAVRSQQDFSYYAPSLPKPESAKNTLRRVCFAADKDDIATVAEYYFDDAEYDKSLVAKRCFDESLKKSRRGKQ